MNHKSVYKLKHIMLTIYLQLCHNVLIVIQYYKRKTKTSRKDLKKGYHMKIRNFEYFASRVARKFNTVIQRYVYNNSVWYAIISVRGVLK